MHNLVDENNKPYHRLIGKKSVDADYSALTEEIESSHKAPNFKVGDRVRITNYRGIFSKACSKSWSKGIFVIDSGLKTNP